MSESYETPALHDCEAKLYPKQNYITRKLLDYVANLTMGTKIPIHKNSVAFSPQANYTNRATIGEVSANFSG
jgi:hypothetical protein